MRTSKTSLQLISAVGEKIQPDSSNLGSWYKKYVLGHTERLALDLDLVRKYARSGDALLDIGSVPPLLLGALKQLGYKVQGVDIAPDRFMRSLSTLSIPVTRCNIETERLPFPDHSFDLVTFNEIFEHLRIDLIFTLSEILRVTKHNGILLLSTPNLKSLSGIINFIARSKACSCQEGIFDEYLKLSTLGHMGHVREYTPREVSEFLGRIGWHVQKLIFRGRYSGYVRNCITSVLVQMKPFVTVVATRH